MLLPTQIAILSALSRARRALEDRVDWRDDRGEVSSTVIVIAIFATLALAVGAIITTKITDKANSIPTD